MLYCLLLTIVSPVHSPHPPYVSFTTHQLYIKMALNPDPELSHQQYRRCSERVQCSVGSSMHVQTLQCSEVQYSSVLCSAVSAVQSVQCSTVYYTGVQYSAIQCIQDCDLLAFVWGLGF